MQFDHHFPTRIEDLGKYPLAGGSQTSFDLQLRNFLKHNQGFRYLGYSCHTTTEYLVGYYMLEPNKTFRVPAYSLLSGAPNIKTNQLMKAMGYVIQFQDVHK